jgi:V8-like Glu-specific endopeptidase
MNRTRNVLLALGVEMVGSKIGSTRHAAGLAAIIGAGAVMGMATVASAQQVHMLTQTLSETALAQINETAKTRTPMRRVLTPEILALIGNGQGRSSQNHGSSAKNFNTVFQYTDSLVSADDTVNSEKRIAGHFAFVLDGGSYRCTASLISRSILVTAGHCVHGGGANGNFISAGAFYPARTGRKGFPYGSAPAIGVIATTGWQTEGELDKGYDVALVVLGKTSGSSKKQMGDVVGWFSFCSRNCLKSYNYLTQLGYPHNYYSGLKMTISQHLELSSPSGGDYIYGSGMQGGSSGGPHIANLGALRDSSPEAGEYRYRNVVFGVTSWGYVDESVKIQGASSLSGPGNSNNFRKMYNRACIIAQRAHGGSSCKKF